MLFLRMKKYCSTTLLESIPTFLFLGLGHILKRAIVLKRYRKWSQPKEVGGCRVYDLGNCGPESRFMVGNLIAHNCAYGAGINRIQQTLNNKEIFLEREDVEKMHQEYWQLFAEVKKYQRRLIQEKNRRGGWIKSATGMPISISEDKEHDILNTMCQYSGHSLLQWENYFIEQEKKRQGIEMNPWINDYHDEMMFEVPIEQVKEGIQLLIKTQAQLNDMLGWDIKIKGDPELHLNLGAIKCEDYEYSEEQKLFLKELIA